MLRRVPVHKKSEATDGDLALLLITGAELAIPFNRSDGQLVAAAFPLKVR